MHSAGTVDALRVASACEQAGGFLLIHFRLRIYACASRTFFQSAGRRWRLSTGFLDEFITAGGNDAR